MKIICKCGCEIKLSNPKFKIEEKPGVPIIAIPCPNCGKKISIVVIDMDKQDLIVKDTKTKEIILSFKEKDNETN